MLSRLFKIGLHSREKVIHSPCLFLNILHLKQDECIVYYVYVSLKGTNNKEDAQERLLNERDWFLPASSSRRCYLDSRQQLKTREEKFLASSRAPSTASARARCGGHVVAAARRTTYTRRAFKLSSAVRAAVSFVVVASVTSYARNRGKARVCTLLSYVIRPWKKGTSDYE